MFGFSFCGGVSQPLILLTLVLLPGVERLLRPAQPTRVVGEVGCRVHLHRQRETGRQEEILQLFFFFFFLLLLMMMMKRNASPRSSLLLRTFRFRTSLWMKPKFLLSSSCFGEKRNAACLHFFISDCWTALASNQARLTTNFLYVFFNFGWDHF